MRDPELIDNQGQPIPEAWRSSYRQKHRESFLQKYSKRTLEELCDDLVAIFDKAAITFDRIAELQRERDQIRADLIETQKKLLATQKRLKWERWKSGLLILVVSGEAVVIGWLVTVVSHTLLR